MIACGNHGFYRGQHCSFYIANIIFGINIIVSSFGGVVTFTTVMITANATVIAIGIAFPGYRSATNNCSL